jgi:hypothetical protein
METVSATNNTITSDILNTMVKMRDFIVLNKMS